MALTCLAVSGIPPKKVKANSVSVNCDDVEELRLDGKSIASIKIGITESATDALFHGDKIILRFKNSVTAYDLSTGDSLFSYSRKGRRDDEFTDISDVWLAGDVLEIYDFNSTKILRFDANTGIILEIMKHNDLDAERFISLRWDEKNHRFIGSRTYNPAEKIPDLAVYDQSHRFVNKIDSPVKKSGFFLSVSPITPSESGRILYHQPFKSVVYEVSGMKLNPVYLIDFGSKNMPKSVVEGEEGKAMQFWMENQDKHALLMDIMESKDVLYLKYMFNKKSFLVRYDRTSGRTKVYRFLPKGGMVVYSKGTVYVIANEDDGTVIYKIPAERLG